MQQHDAFDIQCTCGTVTIRLNGAPAARAYCHCRACQDFYGLPVLAANAWPRDALLVTRGQEHLLDYPHPRLRMQRHYCGNCGETLFGGNRLGMAVVRTNLIARAFNGELPPAHAPAFHLFYAYRTLDVDDALPKYLEGWDGPLYQPTGAQGS